MENTLQREAPSVPCAAFQCGMFRYTAGFSACSPSAVPLCGSVIGNICSADDVVIRRYQMTVFVIHAIRMKELSLTELHVNIQLVPRSKHVDPGF